MCAAAATGATPSLQDGGGINVYYRDGARFALEGRLQEAVAAFRQAIAMNPKDGNAHYSIGNVYAELGRLDDAIAAYRRAININKKDVEAYNGLGIALHRQRRYDESVEAFERAAELYPKWAEPHFHLSQLYKQVGRDMAAQSAYDEAIRLRPDYATHPPRTFTIAEAAKAVAPPKPERTTAVANRERTTTATNSVAVRSSLPTTTNNNNNGSPARITTPKSTAPSRSTTTATSTTPPTTRETANATATDIAATASNPGDAARASYDVGIEHAGAGRYEEAVVAFRRVIVMDRNNTDAYFALGTAYARLERWRESVDAYEQVIRINPKDAEAYERLGRSYAKLRETTPPTAAVVNDDVATNALGINAATSSGASSAVATGAEETGASDGDTGGTAARMSNALNITPAATTTSNQPPTDATTTANGFDPSAVYRVGAGDVLEISMRNGREPRLTSHTVTATGLLDYAPRLAEPLHVAGLTTDEIASRLGAQLKRRGGVANADIAVGVREYASHAIIVSGLVKDAGTKILRREGVPLYVIIAYAQPLPEAGRALVVSHVTGRSTVVDLSDARAMKMLVRPGDVITVGARTRQYFYIAGAVKEAGQKEFNSGLTLAQAVLSAGGITSPLSSVVTIARQASDGRLVTTRHDLTDIRAGRMPDPLIQAGDRIEVLR